MKQLLTFFAVVLMLGCFADAAVAQCSNGYGGGYRGGYGVSRGYYSARPAVSISVGNRGFGGYGGYGYPRSSSFYRGGGYGYGGRSPYGFNYGGRSLYGSPGFYRGGYGGGSRGFISIGF